MADVNVTFGADTSALDAAVAKVKTETQSLTPGAPGSGVLTPVPFGLGGPATSLLERATVAAKANAAAAAEAGTAMKNFARAEDEAGESSKRAGINFGAMAERLAARLVIFEAIRLAIQGIKAVFDEVAGFEAARVQFENLSKGADQLESVESMLMATTKATNIEFAKLSAAVMSLEDAGAGPIEAAAQVDLLGKRAAATGQDVDKLATALEHVKLGEGTVQEMFALAHAAGTAKDALLDEVTAYAKLTQQIKEADRAREEGLATQEKEVRDWERAASEWDKALSTRLSFTEKLIAAETKAEMVPGRRGARAVPAEDLTAKLEAASRGGFLGQQMAGRMRLPPGLVEEYKAGIAQIAAEENITETKVHSYIQRRVLDYHDVLEARKRGNELEREQVDKQIQQQKDLQAETKRQEAIGLDRQKLQISQDLVTAMGDQKNIQGELAKTMGTVAEKFASAATSLKTLVDESPQLLLAMQKIADLAVKISSVIGGRPGMGTPEDRNILTRNPIDVGKLLGNISGVTQIQQAWQQLFPAQVADDTKRTADGVDQLVQTLTGGT